MEVDVDRVPFFDAFLSYASPDRDAVESLAHRLVDLGNEVFFDSWFIHPGQNILKVVFAALRKSHRVVALMTPEYFHSRWTEFELNWKFVEAQLAPAGAHSIIIPAILRACEVPPELRSLRHVDLAGDSAATGFDELASALSHRPRFSIDSYVVSRNDTHYLSEFAAAKLDRFFKFPHERIHDFMQVYDELVQNAFVHVSDAANSVEVTVRADHRQIHLEVSDGGSGFDLAAHNVPPLNVQEPGQSKLSGLLLVRRFCDRVSNQLLDGRHIVTAVLNRERVQELASLSEIDSSPGAVPAWHIVPSRDRYHRFVDATGTRAYVVLPARPMRLADKEEVEEFFASVAVFDYVIVDAEDVVYADSSGLGTLIKFWIAMQRRGATVAFVLTKRVSDLFVSTYKSLPFKVLQSREEALREFAASS